MTARQADIRNVAIIAHVDHGKTTLVDHLLMQSGNFRAGELERLAGGQHDLILDSNPLERERGITILSKNCAVHYLAANGNDYRINIVDTPGHADFGGEVERVLRMADGCLLLVDAFDGPMPQTKFVLAKALEANLRPVVLINKCDRPDAEPKRVIDEVFDLLIELGADDHALDFPVVFSSGRDGWASDTIDRPIEELREGDLRPVFEAIVRHVPPPHAAPSKPLQMLVTTLDYSDYLGRIAIGRVFSGSLKSGQQIALLKRDGSRTEGKVGRILAFAGLGRREVDEILAGDLCAVPGLPTVEIGDTIADPANAVALPPVHVDEPTISMLFRINDSPFAGQDGKYVTSRQIRDRLDKELEHNVALHVESGRTADEFMVSGRGLLHLGILLETMRREGFELSVGRPIVITKEIKGHVCEPLETLVVDCPAAAVGPVMELIGARKGELKKMETRGTTSSHMVFEITSRSLIGLRSRLLTATQGEAIMHHRFERYVPATDDRLHRAQGVMVATETGQVTAHAVENVHDRGFLFVAPGERVYAGQVVGEHNRDNDIVVNITREKQLSNVRMSNKEATVSLKAPRRITLELGLEYIDDGELVEITPAAIRLRKQILNESTRKRLDRQERNREKAGSAG